MTRTAKQPRALVGGVLGLLVVFSSAACAADPTTKPAPQKSATVSRPVVAPAEFSSVMTRMQAAKAAIQQQHLDLLKERYDLGDHPAPYYTDNLMHNLQVERFFKPQTIHGRRATADGPIKTFPLRGIKDSPPYLHDGRLLTLDDTVKFFNLILEHTLTKNEKTDLVAFPRVL